VIRGGNDSIGLISFSCYLVHDHYTFGNQPGGNLVNFQNSVKFLAAIILVFALIPSSTRAQDEPNFHLIFRSAESFSDGNDYATLIKVNVITGESARFLDNDQTYVVNMAWSPDGTRLAGLTLRNFSKAVDEQKPFDLCIFTLEGTIEQCFDQVAAHHSAGQTIRPQGWPIIWIENGQKILFISESEPEVFALSVADLQNGTVELLREFLWEPRGFIYNFSWRPDGAMFGISFQPDSFPWEEVLYTADVSTGEITELCREVPFQIGPLWSADGRYLAYTCRTVHIYDTLKESELTIGFDQAEYHILYNSFFWSNQGYQLAFNGYDSASLPTDYSNIQPPQLYVYDVEDSSLREITREYKIAVTAGPFLQQTWSPDDKFIAFETAVRSYEFEMAVLSLDNPHKALMFHGQGTTNQEPVWRPDILTTF
jgi:Tol biopolymer transport system component